MSNVNKTEAAESIMRREMFLKLFEKAQSISKTDGTVVNHSDSPYVVNTSTIATKLIHETGRWCEYYASDLLISWSDVTASIAKRQVSDELDEHPDIVIFAIRNSGVDGSAYLNCNMNNHDSTYIENYYSRIYAVKISCEVPEDPGADYKTIVVELRDIKREVCSETYNIWRNRFATRTDVVD